MKGCPDVNGYSSGVLTKTAQGKKMMQLETPSFWSVYLPPRLATQQDFPLPRYPVVSEQLLQDVSFFCLTLISRYIVCLWCFSPFLLPDNEIQ